MTLSSPMKRRPLFTLPEKTPSHTDMQKLRGAVNGGGKISVSDAVKILNEYKRRER